MNLCNEFNSMRVANKYISESESESNKLLLLSLSSYGSEGESNYDINFVM